MVPKWKKNDDSMAERNKQIWKISNTHAVGCIIIHAITHIRFNILENKNKNTSAVTALWKNTKEGRGDWKMEKIYKSVFGFLLENGGMKFNFFCTLPSVFIISLLP